MMRPDIEELKDYLKKGELDKLCWIQGEEMLADIVTKVKKNQDGLTKLMLNNRLDLVMKEFNVVQYREGELEISGRQLRDKMVPKDKIPVKKKSVKPLEVSDDMYFESHSNNEDSTQTESRGNNDLLSSEKS